MLPAGDRPMVGTQRLQLGARVPVDIVPDADGKVHPGTRGMSVFRSINDFPPNMVPTRLRSLVPDAAGDDATTMWVRGQGPFENGPFAASLDFRVDPRPRKDHHGCVVPNRAMPLADYQSALAATQDEWEAVEP